MSQEIRVATFNCENLFGRPKIFKSSAARSTLLLGYVVELQAELKKNVFDQQRIKDLKSKLSGFAKINDTRGRHTTGGVGAGDWIGWVELTRKSADNMAVKNTARVIADTEADVICLVEVESRPTLEAFHSNVLNRDFLKARGKAPFEHIMLIDGNDGRGIDVAVMSRFPIDWMRSHMDDTNTYQGKTVKTFSRDCLETKISLPGGRDLVLMANHLKSKGYSPPTDPTSKIRRQGQAARLSSVLDEYDLSRDLVVVAGDLNDYPSGGSLDLLINKPKLYNVNLKLEVADQGTYHSGSKQIDYLLVSDALKQGLKKVIINRQGMFTKSTRKWTMYPEVTSQTTEASDHASVTAVFEI